MRSETRHLTIAGGSVLLPEGLQQAPLFVSDGDVAAGDRGGRRLEATGLLVLPGIVDIHGDAFERQLMPRPGVAVDPSIALVDTDRQLAAHGITTALHGVTASWEPGLRGTSGARAIVAAVEAARPELAVDTRVHLRQEVFNLDAEPELIEWIEGGRVDCLAFNDHFEDTIAARDRPAVLRRYIERTGLSDGEFFAMADRVGARAADVPGSIERLAAAGRAAGVALMSHDDPSPDRRAWFRALGCSIAEFPINDDTAAAAAAAGDAIVFGAPNALRGGSHRGNSSAAAMVERGLCTALASDYYYPALLHAAFRLAREDRATFSQAWDLVSAGPADALGLRDRGRLAVGARADLILVAAEPRPRVVATLVAGRIVFLTEAERLS